MRHTAYGLALVLPAVIGLGCSSTKSSPQTDAGKGSNGGDVDVGPSVLDTGHRADGRDTGGADRSLNDSSPPRDTKPGGIDASAQDTKDGRSATPDAAGKADTKRDTGPATAIEAGSAGGPDLADDTVDEPDLPVDTAPPLGSCAAPIDIPYSTGYAEISVTTLGSQHAIDFPCVANGSDFVFRIQSNAREIAYADTFGAAWNTALFFSDTCEKPTPPADGVVTCNDDACGTLQSQAVAILSYGYHYLVVSGANGESGPVTVRFMRAPVGNGPPVALPPGTGVLTGATAGVDSTRTCDTTGPKNSYWWATCPNAVGGAFHASTCKGATWDTFLILQIPQSEIVTCADDDQACGMQSTVDTTIPAGPGLFVLSVTGALLRSYGDYTLNYVRP
jgi:hypothetical protein